MYLKRMELVGFKSFTTKTKIVFEPGISCIVGPNGSGKSNIADALRWVMGEQSARNIRGGKLEDVIFSGSKKRRPLGMAEVTLVLDNSDGYLSLPYTEISVTRRAIRNGSSEYEINGQPCRLKDIRDLFVDTGVGVEGSSLIDQGRIHELVSCRPEERRVFVEEAAGIVKYRERKKEACRKLAETERHLERVGDIIHELGDRLDPLAKQADKAQRYLTLKEESDRMEIGISVRVLSEAEEKIAALDQEIDQDTKALLALESQRLQAQAAAEELCLALSALDEQVSTAAQDYYALQNQQQKAEGELNLVKNRYANAQRDQERLGQELAALEQSMAAKQQEFADLSRHIERTQQELNAQEQGLVQGEGGKSDLRLLAAAREEKLAALQKESAEAQSQLAAQQSQLDLRRQMLAKNQQALAQVQQEAEALEQEQAENTAALTQAEESLASAMAESKTYAALVNRSEEKLRQLNHTVQEKAGEEGECRYQVRSLETKVSMLQEMIDSYEGFYPGVKGLMKACGSGNGPAGVLGVLSELMDVPEQYRVGIEAYLGASLQNIVTETGEHAKQAVAYLKQHQLGRATFLPLDMLQVRPARDFSQALQRKGVFGQASALIHCADKYRPAVEFLLNNVLLCENMDVALLAAKDLHYRSSVVTLDGDLVSPGGAVTGGSRQKKNSDLLGQRGKLTQAKAELKDGEAALAQASQALSQAREELHTATEENETLLLRLRELSNQINETTSLKQRLQVQGEEGKKRLGALVAQKESLLREGKDLSLDVESQAKAGQEAAQQGNRLAEALAQASQALEEVQAQMESRNEDITMQKMALATSRQKLHGQKLTLERLEKEIAGLQWDAEDKAADRDEAAAECTLCAQQSQEGKAALTALAQNIHAAESALETMRHGQAGETARLRELENTERTLLHQEDKAKTELHQIELRRERWQADLENESAKLAEQFQLNLAQAREKVGEDIPSRSAMLQRLGQLRRDIGALGNVNLDAIQEYAEVQERYTFLTGQRDDMLEAKNKLNTVIQEMDTLMTSRFRDTFTKLNQAFQDSFQRLFGGGEGALFLSEPGNLLETGVELSVHPPGKKVSNYNLLSGGEKALIGMAMMFATLTVRPTPFCFMDEVDAALDEANIGRFTSYLRDRTDRSQFIMITHRQATMDAAHVLWGVTMEEEGVSKVISVRLGPLEA